MLGDLQECLPRDGEDAVTDRMAGYDEALKLPRQLLQPVCRTILQERHAGLEVWTSTKVRDMEATDLAGHRC